MTAEEAKKSLKTSIAAHQTAKKVIKCKNAHRQTFQCYVFISVSSCITSPGTYNVVLL